VPPTAEDLKQRFGAESPTFAFLKDELGHLFEAAQVQPSVRMKFAMWEKYLEVVYGDTQAGDGLFIKHTYLATLAKIMVFLRINGGQVPPRDLVIPILNGTVFDDFGITNFIEEDFFAWVLVPEIRKDVEDHVLRLIHQLVIYDLAELNEDVFKELYQELVDPEVRRGLGEYYTPDWLAEFLLRPKLHESPEATILDPSCGSGTFLFIAIRLKISELRSRGWKSADILSHIQMSVVGVDIHPLAVIISRTNYLLALRDLLGARKGSMTIPVYLSDSIKLPEFISDVQENREVYRVEATAEAFFMIPKAIANRSAVLDSVIGTMHAFAKRYEEGKPTRKGTLESFANAVTTSGSVNPADLRVFHRNMEILLDLIDGKEDAIWTFLLRNTYRPIALSDTKFDLVIGNPPWIVMNVIKNPSYQKFLKRSSGEAGLLDGKSPHLYTHMEIATLFYLACARLYLKKKGAISFVMPATIISGDQHAAFRTGHFRGLKLGFRKIVDLRNVEPLFSVGACVLESSSQAETEYPIDGVSISGKLKRKNVSLEEASTTLTFRTSSFALNRTGARTYLQEDTGIAGVQLGRSSYFASFSEGATIVPRPFWFVEVVRHPVLGADMNEPVVKSSARAKKKGKKKYADVFFEGQIEAAFLFGLVTGSEMVPFGLTLRNLTVLPIEPAGAGFRIVKREEAERRGLTHLANWLDRAERVWMEKRGSKSKGPDIYQWIDYRHKLTDQAPKLRYAVVYEAVGTYLVACVVDKKGGTIETPDGKVKTSGTLIDYSTIYYETADREEADYLSAVFNSKIMDDLIKPMQSTGLFGPRNIWKKVLEIPIPRFSADNADHKALAKLGKACEEKVGAALPDYDGIGSIGRVRALIRESLLPELTEITAIVSRILSRGAKGKKRLKDFEKAD
jgi:hypothetical protein